MKRVLLIILLALPSWAWSVTLVVGMEAANNAPFEYLDESNRLTGFHVKLVRAVAERLGWEIRIQREPWKRAMMSLRKGRVDAVTYVARSPDRAQFARFLPGNLLHVSRTTLYIDRERSDEIHYSEPLREMVRTWHTAVPNGYLMSDRVRKLIDEGAPISQPTVSQSELFRMLLNGRYDAVFGSMRALELAREESPELGDRIQQLPAAAFPGKRMYLAFSLKGDPAIAEQFANAFNAFRAEPAYQALAQRFNVQDRLPTAQDVNASQ
ncbi:amino acid ABC transporter substrate-binding protein (PAAT family) [Tamilnaduibacter salinus]|uniref:Amino acid ABC transporter substrate-binding protein n=1 Tax=Tamilnaduibacter salinus TaxID=1484056 RepID=A0A2A2I503_9GAMM|nr:transporter substrate-binding domain-containing protein [Tamilnaduibacter salinus]PAV27091.1 amino acid ABC transporter substrate-binding protein [Tamilnaduibacter salinus]PVY77554.1 amino acid ABC transporter substrate-binding protein (PAAT family) [Tamilnaduibacter salinus]